MTAFRVSATGSGDLTYAQTRSKKFEPLTRSLRVVAGAGWMDRLAAVHALLPAGAAYSHVTALRIYGIDFGDEFPLHVTVPRGVNRGSRELVAWHRSDLQGKRRTVSGLTITVPHKTWCDLGAVLDLPDLVAVTDLLLRRGLLTREELIVPAGQRGAANLRKAARLADPRSNSVRESQLRVHMHESGLPAPDLNPNIYDEGEWIAVSDFVWWQYRSIVEYDGGHHLTLQQKHQDEITRAQLRRAGWDVMALDDKHYKRLKVTMAQIEEMLVRHGWRP